MSIPRCALAGESGAYVPVAPSDVAQPGKIATTAARTRLA
jgi:hypothetical protein